MHAACAAGYIDVEADEIAPGYAVLLMYIMLVSGALRTKAASSTSSQMTAHPSALRQFL